MNVEGLQRANGNSSRSNNFHSTGKAILQKFPECLGLFLYSKTVSIGFSLLIDDREMWTFGNHGESLSCILA